MTVHFSFTVSTRGRTDGAVFPLLCQTRGRTNGAFSLYCVKRGVGLPVHFPFTVSNAGRTNGAFSLYCVKHRVGLTVHFRAVIDLKKFIILTINPGLSYPDEVNFATSLSEPFAMCLCHVA